MMVTKYILPAVHQKQIATLYSLEARTWSSHRKCQLEVTYEEELNDQFLQQTTPGGGGVVTERKILQYQ
jgi:hypothetical protein